jgi:enoyl-CoA hydratase/carnithine racemase
MTGLLDALERARRDPEVRVVILGSAIAGRFCAGLDLGTFLKNSPTQVHDLVDQIYARLCDVQFNLGKPSIAAISGAARGGGMSVAISCDLIVAAHDATFGYPEIDIGLLPAIHYTHLHRIVGRYRAFDLLFTGRTFPAQEAQALGLVNRIAADGDVLGEARKLARVLAGKSPELMRKGKAAFTQAIDSGYRQGLAGAVNLATAVSGLDDSREGLTAFVEKRKTRWKAP